jgi:pSer/pThr/pTyr-binding forkhead associated (FHA) protein
VKVVLTVMGGKHNGRQIPVTVPEFRIGRDPQCHLRPTSAEISRFHCAILTRENGVFIRDYGSKNGTLVNHRLLQGGDLQLQDGDVIEVGPLAFMLSITGLAAPEAPAAPTEAPVEAQVLDLAGRTQEPSPDETIFLQVAEMGAGPVQRPADAGPILVLE